MFVRGGLFSYLAISSCTITLRNNRITFFYSILKRIQLESESYGQRCIGDVVEMIVHKIQSDVNDMRYSLWFFLHICQF